MPISYWNILKFTYNPSQASSTLQRSMNSFPSASLFFLPLLPLKFILCRPRARRPKIFEEEEEGGVGGEGESPDSVQSNTAQHLGNRGHHRHITRQGNMRTSISEV